MAKRRPKLAEQQDPLRVRCNHVLIWLTPIMLFAPYSLTAYLGTLKLTPGKLLATLLVLPAIFNLLSGVMAGCRRLVAADFLALALTLWMIAAPTAVSRSDIFVSAASQSLEFFGTFMIGRAFFYGTDALATFGKALSLVVIAVTVLGLLETVSHHYIVSETLAAAFYSPGEALDADYPQLNRRVLGFQFLRAASTFDHPILFGMFCAISASILFYIRSAGITFVSLLLCMIGCLLALSSAPLMAVAIGVAVGIYDVLLRRAVWRWKAMSTLIVVTLILICGVSNNPLTWIIRNCTFDPQTGYYRLLQWDAALPFIDQHLWTGNGFQKTGNQFVDGSIDSLWLAKALGYGLPGVILLLLVGASVMIPTPGAAGLRARRVDVDRSCTGFSLAIVLFGVIGLTVYYWNGIWLYAALCLGIRASLQEYCSTMAFAPTINRIRTVRSDIAVRKPVLSRSAQLTPTQIA